MIDEKSAFLNWLFSEDDSGEIRMIKSYKDWSGEDSLLEFTQERFKKAVAVDGDQGKDAAFQEEMRRS